VKLTKRKELDFIHNFLSSVCTALKGTTEYKNEVLKARGFLVDTTPDGGFVFDERSNSSFESDIYMKYLSAQDDELEKLFLKNSAYSSDGADGYRALDNWKHCFASCNHRLGDTICTLHADPFIARYVKALSTIGIHTAMSCDGWHDKQINDRGPGRGMFTNNPVWIVFHDRFSLIWLRILHDFDERLPSTAALGFNVVQHNTSGLSEYVSRDTYRGCGYVQPDKTLFISCVEPNERLDKYIMLNRAAQAIYKNREYFYSVKWKTIELLKGERKDGLPADRVFRMMVEAYLRTDTYNAQLRDFSPLPIK